MRPYHSPVPARALPLARHRQEATLGVVALVLTAVFATGWQLGGVALNLLGMAS